MKVLRFFIFMISVFILVVAVMNQSISSYIEQKYHISYYPQNDILKEANAFKMKLEQIRAILSNEPLFFSDDLNESVILDESDLNKSIVPEKIDEKKDEESEEEKKEESKQINLADLNIIDPKEGEEFLLIGDSLMQGVSIALSRDLRNLGFNVTDLSRQNTGLAYKSYFNWAEATKKAFLANKNIKYLVILLGANDPWDIKRDGIFRHFNTPDWLEIYTERVDEIIQIAKKNKARVLWFEVPPVKSDDFERKMQVLNRIYGEEVLKNKEIFINTRQAFAINNKFSSYIKDNDNKSVKMRTDDGVHFTPAGGRQMSSLLLKHIKNKEVNEE
ncbi:MULTISPECIES: GDSL-type esterase/lipase family protein [unclassified Campylobacter]|uniref:SGNH/GDSL hydrolase family protein n=1 Tax=unclassified Campylobacter TaxID=2593542 RepID=UPI00123810B1|nr:MULTISPECIES: GDSL-type esterase/lipase family protein [unclassified Campylobacter]KAA6224644.1 DUF459 domain-containing protein [Campylobacter sp. LR185c]KAA6225644.1 DUF459 domain-containing protein [Campylobacter sp. LR286c]KAA6225763.1 DUF459 domain-containing protein [Campylobacter sp. LR196d]KAA6229617.1 DUF459 domain-containing protein [Campylobacter sp. LR291e]KAA6230138.1 DUF459 domain-containing protein [Campylobacter sp. LR264d]